MQETKVFLEEVFPQTLKKKAVSIHGRSSKFFINKGKATAIIFLYVIIRKTCHVSVSLGANVVPCEVRAESKHLV